MWVIRKKNLVTGERAYWVHANWWTVNYENARSMDTSKEMSEKFRIGSGYIALTGQEVWAPVPLEELVHEEKLGANKCG